MNIDAIKPTAKEFEELLTSYGLTMSQLAMNNVLTRYPNDYYAKQIPALEQMANIKKKRLIAYYTIALL